MAIEFSPSSKPSLFTTASRINKTRLAFENLPDSRQKATANHLNYAIADAALSAFSVFFTQSPSFLDYQTRMQKAHGKNNAQSLLGVHQIPSANQIRNLLDPVPPETVFPLLREIGDGPTPARLSRAGSWCQRPAAGGLGWHGLFLLRENLRSLL